MSSNNSIMEKGPIAWMIQNPVCANLIMFILLIGGLMTAYSIKQEVFPEFIMDRVTISVPYPGASPEEVEQGIILVLEENLRGVEGVKELNSTAREGSGTVTIDLLEGTDLQKIYQDVQQVVARINTFPQDAEEATVSIPSRQHEVMSVALFGKLPERTLREQASVIREQLLQSPEITQVELSGIRDYEITVSISKDALQKYNLTISAIADKIKKLAMELPSGGIKTSGGEILVRMRDRKDYGHEFARLPVVTSENGTTVLLADIAEVTDGFEDTEKFGFYNGMPAVMIDVYRIGEQTPVAVATAAREELDKIIPALPRGLNLKIIDDNSDVYKQRLFLLLRNGRLGLILVLIILGLFLELRLAFWVMMGIPISFLGGMIMLPYANVSINMISMFGFLIALGIVVDDAIVVGENIYEHHEQGESFLTAAISGTREVAVPVTFSVLTNIVTFMPLMFLPGFIGKIWFVIPVVVILVFALSLFESLFILPAHIGHMHEKRGVIGTFITTHTKRFNHWFNKKVETIYGPLLDFLLKNRYATCAAGLAVFIITLGYVQSGRIGMVPMMQVESDYSNVSAALPYGSPVEKSYDLLSIITKAAEDVAAEHGGDKLLAGIYSEIGRSFRGTSGSHVVMIRAYLTPSEVRPISTREFTNLWRKKVGRIPGLEAILFESDRGGPGSGATLSVELGHSNTHVLDLASSELAERLANYAQVSDIDDGFSDGKPQLDFSLKPEGVVLGLTTSDVARQIRNALYGTDALRQQRGRDEVTVSVRLPKSERSSEKDIDEMLILTPRGSYVPLRDIATVTRGQAFTSIVRRDGRRIINVTANVTPASDSENILQDVLKNIMPELQQKYPGLDYGYSGRQKDLREGMHSLVSGFLIALLAIYSLLAIPFKSYTQPLIIMVSIPFGVVGAVIAHIMMGYPLSLMSMMGIVALAGVVVNDSLILIDFTNSRMKDGMTPHDAVHSAAIRRFRPILLTTLTTFGGLAPMIFESSRQARFMIPMAISLGYGIVFSTLITLVLIPALYIILEDLGKIKKAVWE